MHQCRLATSLLTVTVWGLLSTSVGCPGRFADGPPRSNRMRAGHAPTPYTTDELRKACRTGVWRLYRVATTGRPSSYRILWFKRADKAGAVVVSAMTDMKGRPFGEQLRLKVLWKGLQSHGSFPAGATTIRTEKRTTPAGTFDCWRYEVVRRVAGRREVRRLWFAKKLPGPPVDLVRRVNGKVVQRMTLVGRGRSRSAPRPITPAR